MKQLQIKVDKDNVSLVHPIPQITTGEYHVTQVSFDFSEEWNDKTKKARFGDVEVDVINDACYFPMFLKTGTIPIKVYGYNEEVVDGETIKVLVYSPQPALIHVGQGSYDGTAGHDSPVPSGDEYAEYMTKSRLWTGYSAFFNSLEDVPAEIQSEFESVDISELTTAQVEEKIEILNKMLSEDSATHFITTDSVQSGINKTLYDSKIALRKHGDLVGLAGIELDGTSMTPVIKLDRTYTPYAGGKIAEVNFYPDKITVKKGTVSGTTEEKTIFYPGAETSGQNPEVFALKSEVVTLSDIIGNWTFDNTVAATCTSLDELFYYLYEDVLGQWDSSHQNTITDEIEHIDAVIEAFDPENIPSALSDLSDDATHRTVTDAEKATWNNKADIADIPDIPANISYFDNDVGYLTEHQDISDKADLSDVPTALADLTDDSTHRTVTDAEKTTWNGKVSDKTYTHTQSESSATWVIVHNLNKYPCTVIVNSAGEEVIGDIKYDSTNQITVTFKGAFKGTAILN